MISSNLKSLYHACLAGPPCCIRSDVQLVYGGTARTGRQKWGRLPIGSVMARCASQSPATPPCMQTTGCRSCERVAFWTRLPTTCMLMTLATTSGAPRFGERPRPVKTPAQHRGTRLSTRARQGRARQQRRHASQADRGRQQAAVHTATCDRPRGRCPSTISSARQRKWHVLRRATQEPIGRARRQRKNDHGMPTQLGGKVGQRASTNHTEYRGAARVALPGERCEGHLRA